MTRTIAVLPKLGDERWLVEMIDATRVEAMARKAGWNGTDSVREVCEPEDAAVYDMHPSLDAAVAATREWLKLGLSFYGCVIIDHQVFEQFQDDRGNRVKGADWEITRVTKSRWMVNASGCSNDQPHILARFGPWCYARRLSAREWRRGVGVRTVGAVTWRHTAFK